MTWLNCLQLLGKETEKFGGDTLLNGQEQLHQIKRQMEGWTDNALKVFGRHRGLEGRQHPDQENMAKMNEVTEMSHLFVEWIVIFQTCAIIQ